MHLQRIQALRDALAVLDDSAFHFSDFVTEYDQENKCGTVCCAAGHLPAIDPENWKWVAYEEDIGNGNTRTKASIRYKLDFVSGNIFINLEHYFELDYITIRRVFSNASEPPSNDFFYGKAAHLVTRHDVIKALDVLIAAV